MKYAYITGATGTIGMALVSRLLKEKVTVTVFVREGSGRSSNLKVFAEEHKRGQLIITTAGLDKLAELKDTPGICKAGEALGGRESVFYHLGWNGTFGAARSDRSLQQENVQYTMDAIRLAHSLGCSCFVGAGSQAEYGRVTGKLTPDTPAAPENEYGRAKLAAGEQGSALCSSLGMNFCWVRILSVYGPYDGPDTMVMSTIRSLLAGQAALLTEGVQIWDYLYSEDAAEALYRIGVTWSGRQEETRVRGGQPDLRVYCLGSGQGRPLREYITELCRQTGADMGLLRFGAVPYGPAQVMELTADISCLINDTGFFPKTGFSEGIRSTIEWYIHFYEKRNESGKDR